MPLYVDQFSTEYDFPPYDAEPTCTYVIASTPRSGSHMLGHALGSTGALGFPLEYLNRANLPSWQRRLGAETPRQTLDAIKRIRTSPNGCFGLKLHYDQLVSIAPHIEPGDLLDRARVVRLRRRDLLAQAVSLAVARQTGSWISAQVPTREPVYDGDAIEKALGDIAWSDAQWDVALARMGVQPLDLAFEEVVADVDAAVKRVAAFLGIPDAALRPRPTPRPAQQSGNVNEVWQRTFILEGRDPLQPIAAAPPRPRTGSAVERTLKALLAPFSR